MRYRKLSFEDVFTVLRTNRFRSDHERLLTLCWSHEWAWVYTHVFPVVQEINRMRPTGNGPFPDPVIAVSASVSGLRFVAEPLPTGSLHN